MADTPEDPNAVPPLEPAADAAADQAPAPPPEAQEEAFESQLDSIRIKVEAFEGPLDLLVHLIKKNKMNVYDIQIAVITKQ